MSDYHAVVVVLGDLGRSPRMMYHTKSLLHAEKISRVSVIGYKGESLNITNSKLHEYRMNIGSNNSKSRLLGVIWKGLILLVQLFWIFIRLPFYQLIIIQNPPSIPVVILVYFMSLFNGATIMIDWHNLGYTMYNQSTSSGRCLSKLTKFMEYISGRFLAHNNICVSKAMKKWLENEFNLKNVSVFYDRPASSFSKYGPSINQRHELFMKLNLTESALFPDSESNVVETNHTIHTYGDGNYVNLKVNRIPIIISSTSWTEDEDFNILLDALVELEEYILMPNNSNDNNKKVVVIITGKGPLKDVFTQHVDILRAGGKLKNIAIITPWLEAKDYPLLMSCADFGVCLHTSSSGLDLPMKVVDMFGSGLPVMAIDFPALPELVKHNENGIIFNTSGELAKSMIQVLYVDRSSLIKLREGNIGMNTWDYTWTNLMQPIVLEVFSSSRKRFRRSTTCIFLFSMAALRIVAFYLTNKK